MTLSEIGPRTYALIAAASSFACAAALRLTAELASRTAVLLFCCALRMRGEHTTVMTQSPRRPVGNSHPLCRIRKEAHRLGRPRFRGFAFSATRNSQPTPFMHHREAMRTFRASDIRKTTVFGMRLEHTVARGYRVRNIRGVFGMGVRTPTSETDPSRSYARRGRPSASPRQRSSRRRRQTGAFGQLRSYRIALVSGR
jgi:hypothetical protein